MYERTDKRRIYQLIEMYLSGQIDEVSFCDEFYESYDLEVDHSTLTKEERKAFIELGVVAGRFSEFEEDHKKYPGTYYTKEKLKQQILKTKEDLKQQWFFEEINNE